jgi:radical SAM family uncharacterized protein/radical SAM-linked protein
VLTRLEAEKYILLIPSISNLIVRVMEKFLNAVEKPGRYLACEFNAFRKSFDRANVRFVLAFPDVYEVGMSHLGLKVLYEILNQAEDVMADRVYAPWIDLERNLRERSEPLRGLETQRPLRDFHFVGFSLQYELSYTNILTILDLGGIPIQAKERGPEDPWVIGGGPCAFNPEPLAEIFDFFVLGEAEGVLPELVEVFREWQTSEGKREDFLREVMKIGGIYVPTFFGVSYASDGVIAAVEPRYGDYASVTRRLIPDLDTGSPIPVKPLVPLLDIVHNRLGLEIARGCTGGCRFCQAGFIYRPVRERHPGVVMDRAKEALANSGFEEMSLLSLSTGDYCQIGPLLTALMGHCLPRKIAVSFPSMRVGTLTPELMELIRRVRKTGFTLAPEAGSERLRRVINKRILGEDLLVAAENAFDLGWRLLKLYFMIGLPSENHADLDALVNLCMEVWHRAKPSRSSVNVSISTFVPKPQTPFQWVPQIGGQAIEECLAHLKARLKRPGLRVKWHRTGHSLLEAVFARGDRRLGKVLIGAWQLGARFDGWSELFREDLWRQAFSEAGLDPSFYANRERPMKEILPWDHLSAGVTKGFLAQEYQHAMQEAFTEDCRFGACSQCGVCDHQSIRPLLHKNLDEAVPLSNEDVTQEVDASFLYWFRYSKTDVGRFYGQLEIAQGFSRAVRRAELPAVMTKGFHPHVKLSFVEALPLGMESRIEEGYLRLSQRLEAAEIHSRLNDQLSVGLRVEEVLSTEKPLVRCPIRRVTYIVSELLPLRVRRVLQSWPRRLEETLYKKTKRGGARAALGDILLDVRQLNESSFEMDLCEGAQVNFRPMGILSHLLDEPLEVLMGCRICRVAVVPFTGLEEECHVLGAYHKR